MPKKSNDDDDEYDDDSARLGKQKATQESEGMNRHDAYELHPFCHW